MSITKKPYEISLWDEQLVWHRRELEPVFINENDYEPGKYFSQNPQVDGAIPYALDFGSYRDDQRYYQIKKDGKFLENNSDISNNEDWKVDGSVYTVTRLKKFEIGETYFLFSNKSREFSEVEVKEKD
jgi:hypothetical protein